MTSFVGIQIRKQTVCFEIDRQLIEYPLLFQVKVKQLEDLIQRIDGELHSHLVNTEVVYLQFSFRWMNNLLMRELPVKASIRLWDTYLSQASTSYPVTLNSFRNTGIFVVHNSILFSSPLVLLSNLDLDGFSPAVFLLVPHINS